MKTQWISLWGAADLEEFSTPRDETGKRFPYAISWVVPMNPQIMESIQDGPNPAYADEYARVNDRINDLAVLLAGEMAENGFRALALAASVRSDQVSIKGDFPQPAVRSRHHVQRSVHPWRIRQILAAQDPLGPPGAE